MFLGIGVGSGLLADARLLFHRFIGTRLRAEGGAKVGLLIETMKWITYLNRMTYESLE